MKLLAIDPGSKNLGYTAINILDDRFVLMKYGVISSNKKKQVQRLESIYWDLKMLFDEVKPSKVAIETGFINNNYKNAIIPLARTQGIIIGLCAEYLADLHEYEPKTIKKCVWSGKASKMDIAHIVKNYMHIDQSKQLGTDITDSMAIAICFMHREILQANGSV